VPSLKRDIAALFPPSHADGAFPPHHVTVDRGHGRNEIRSIWVSPHVADVNFPGVFQAFRIHRQIYDLNWNPARKPETVHGITSLTAWQANPADLLAGNRGHWEVETASTTSATALSTKTVPRSAPAHLRPAKTQQKISGRLRSEETTRHRYAIRGYISTAARHRASVLTALRDALLGQPWMPPIPEPP
jgi:hypothetical protein